MTLARAVAITGSVEAVARRLEATSFTASLWLSGKQPIPTPVFLKLVDVLADDQVMRLHRTGA